MANNSKVKSGISLYSPNITEKLKTIAVPEDSKFVIKNIEDKLGDPHPFDYSIIDGLMKKFGLVNAVIDKTVDFVVGPKLNIECKDKRAKQILDDFLNKTEFRLFVKPWAKEAFAKGSGYMEIAGLDNNKDDEIAIKVVSSNSMYIKRDETGNTTGYVQYIGASTNRIDDTKVINLKPEEIVQLDNNKIGNCTYGLGMIYSALQTIEEFLMAQKAIHKLTKRKANMPIWVKLGNAEKDDYPQQAQIDAFGEKLQYMDETTEWVTGPNVEIKTVDTGNVADKFIGVLNNDYKLLSYSFQVPEVILGAGNVAEGLAKVQMDTFDRRIKSLQDEIGSVIKHRVLRRILIKNGLDVEFSVIWGELNEEDKEKLVLQYNSLLGNMSISPGFKFEIEKKLANVLEIDYDAVQAFNDENEMNMAKKGLQPDGQPLPDNAEEPEEKPNPEREREEGEKLPEVPGQKSLESKQPDELMYEDLGDITIQEWINFNYLDLKHNIVSAIAADKFLNLKASNAIEREAGYLSAAKVRQVKQVFTEGFMLNKSVKDIETKVQKIAGPLYKYNEKGLILDNGEKIIRLDSLTRANMIARTETVRLANIGNLDFYKTKGFETVRFSASLSERTCEECEGMNGTMYNIEESYDVIPVHINCRCAFLPVVQEQLNVQTIKEGWVTGKDGRKYYIDDEGNMLSGKEAIYTSEIEKNTDRFYNDDASEKLPSSIKTQNYKDELIQKYGDKKEYSMMVDDLELYAATGTTAFRDKLEVYADKNSDTFKIHKKITEKYLKEKYGSNVIDLHRGVSREELEFSNINKLTSYTSDIRVAQKFADSVPRGRVRSTSFNIKHIYYESGATYGFKFSESEFLVKRGY